MYTVSCLFTVLHTADVWSLVRSYKMSRCMNCKLFRICQERFPIFVHNKSVFSATAGSAARIMLIWVDDTVELNLEQEIQLTFGVTTQSWQ